MTTKQEEMIKSLRLQGLSYGTIAKRLDMKRETVKSHCYRRGLSRRAMETPSFTGDIGRCRNCGAEVRQDPKRKRKIFCCDACRMQWWNSHQHLVKRKTYFDVVCQNCGETFRAFGDRNRKYCCHRCYIEDRFGRG